MSEGRFIIPVMIPVYNGEAYLGGAIDDVHAQAYRPIEMMQRMPRTIQSMVGDL